MQPDNPERLNFWQRTGRQFDSVGPLGKLLLVVYYGVAFTLIVLIAQWAGRLLDPSAAASPPST